MLIPTNPKIYHIVHVDRLPSIIADGYLWCDAEMDASRPDTGTTIGISDIKRRRRERMLPSRRGLHVGDCVPFYFCPRSVMLYVIWRANHPELSYRGGQGPIIHLEADLRETVAWAASNERRWAFTSSNAASNYFDDFSDLANLDKLDWDAIQAFQWSDRRERKQAEFLVERSFPWSMISHIGVTPVKFMIECWQRCGRPRIARLYRSRWIGTTDHLGGQHDRV